MWRREEKQGFYAMDRRTDRSAKNGPSLVIEKPAPWGREKKKIEQLRTRRTDNERTERIYDRDVRVETKGKRKNLTHRKKKKEDGRKPASDRGEP